MSRLDHIPADSEASAAALPGSDPLPATGLTWGRLPLGFLPAPLRAPSWLTARPIAHRGLHDAEHHGRPEGATAPPIVENSLSAARLAMAGAYAIECDVQRSADGEAMVFHDDQLDRLTGRSGRLDGLRAATLADIPLKGASDRIPTLAQLLGLIGGKVPLICEIKSRFDGDMRLADRVAAIAAGYAGPLAFKSFDPMVLAHLRQLELARPLGIVAEARFDDPDAAALPETLRLAMIHLLHVPATRPDFVSYCIDDLPHAAPQLCRTALGRPLMTWTVRTEAQRQHAAQWADQIVFEGLRP